MLLLLGILTAVGLMLFNLLFSSGQITVQTRNFSSASPLKSRSSEIWILIAGFRIPTVTHTHAYPRTTWHCYMQPSTNVHKLLVCQNATIVLKDNFNLFTEGHILLHVWTHRSDGTNNQKGFYIVHFTSSQLSSIDYITVIFQSLLINSRLYGKRVSGAKIQYACQIWHICKLTRET